MSNRTSTEYCSTSKITGTAAVTPSARIARALDRDMFGTNPALQGAWAPRHHRYRRTSGRFLPETDACRTTFPGKRMIRHLVKAALLALLALMSMQDYRSAAQAHERPYFMPLVERDRLHGLISKEAWAKADH